MINLGGIPEVIPTLTKTNRNKWVRNLLLFTAPLGFMYITAVIGIIQLPDHQVSYKDFIPTKMVQGGLILYVLNALQDLLRKYIASNS